MINHLLALVKREIWEHRSIYVTPIAIAIIVTLGVLAMLMFASGFATKLDLAIFGAQNIVGEPERKAALIAFFITTSMVFVVALAILTVFYCLDSLYAERKDKSILFWRSLPVTDAETVGSKLIVAILVLPIAATIGIIVTHFVNLVVTSIWVSMKGGDASVLIWGSVSLFDNWAAAFIALMATGIWMSPFIGWFLLVSAYTKRSPLLMAFMPLILIGIIEPIVMGTHVFAEKVLARGDGLPLIHTDNLDRFFDEEEWRIAAESLSLLDQLDLLMFFGSPSTWAGIVICGLLSFGAVYVRRYRDES